MNTILNHLSWPLIDFQLGATLLLGLALGGVWWSRQPARRVALGWAAALALVGLGVAAALPVWPRWHSVHPVSVPAPASLQSPLSGSALPESLPSRAEHEFASTSAPTSSHTTTVFRMPTAASVLPWLMRLYILGGAAVSLWLLLGVIEAIWLCRTARPAPESLLTQLREIQGNHARLPRLLLSSRIHNAVALGIRQPTIFLPAALAKQADEQSLRAVLAHETAHIRNRDLWLLGLMRGLLVVLFPHPLYWMIRRLIRDSQEALADAVAAQSQENDYAEGLVAWMRQVANPRRVRVAAAMGIWERRSELSRRIGLLLDETFTVQTSLSHRWRLGIVASAGIAALTISVLTVRPATATNPAPAVTQAEVSSTKDTNALTFTGRVIDKFTRAPVEGATVHVKRDIYSSTERRTLQETEHVTDTNGQFKFSLTPEQASDVHLYLDFEVTHPNYTRRPWDGYALSMIRKNLSLGERPFFEELDMAPAESISGTVLNPDGTAASGVKILVYSKANKDDWAEYGSFDNTNTDASGRFTVNAAKGGEAVLWLLPQQFSPSTHLIHQQRGDLGLLTLENGIRLSGQVFDSEGQPVFHVWINAELSDGPAKQNIGMPVMDALGRSALTDEHGQFAMGPLPAGDYDLLTSEYARDESGTDDHTRYPEPDVFLHEDLHLEEGHATQTVKIQAVPHVLVGIQQLNGQGQPHKSHEIHFFGQLRGHSWWGTGRPDDNGRITMKVPKGLTNAQFDLLVNEHQATRYRLSDDAPWRNEEKMRPAILDRDSTNISVIYYTSPILLVRAQAPDGSAITNFSCAITYPEGRTPNDQPPHWISGTTGDVNFEKQQDGRWRSKGLLPDEKVQLTVQAEGYQSWSSSLTLAEGATNEIVARLEQ